MWIWRLGEVDLGNSGVHGCGHLGEVGEAGRDGGNWGLQ